METGAGYEPQAWESFAVAEVGAAAAHSHSSTGVLAIGTKLLVPGVERVPLGIIMTVTGLALGLIVVRFSGINVTERQYRKPTLLTAGIAILATLLLTVSGASLALGAGGGLYWLAPGVLVAFAIGLVKRLGGPRGDPALRRLAPAAWARSACRNGRRPADTRGQPHLPTGEGCARRCSDAVH
jgi:hypothetical protein